MVGGLAELVSASVVHSRILKLGSGNFFFAAVTSHHDLLAQ
jgi:hypothetical protein